MKSIALVLAKKSPNHVDQTRSMPGPCRVDVLQVYKLHWWFGATMFTLHETNS